MNFDFSFREGGFFRGDVGNIQDWDRAPLSRDTKAGRRTGSGRTPSCSLAIVQLHGSHTCMSQILPNLPFTVTGSLGEDVRGSR